MPSAAHPDLAHRLAVARGDAAADLLLTGGRVLDVHTGRLRDAAVAIAGGVVCGVGDYTQAHAGTDVQGAVLAPALIEGHMHLESTLLAPAEAAGLLARGGTGTVVADPHEIANVVGPDGVRWMRAEVADAPLDVRLQVPSCVPATELATTGGRIDAADVAVLLGEGGGLGLAELMDFPSAIAGREHVLAKVRAAAGAIVDGHAPGVRGRALQAYALLASSDHEATTAEEGREKLAAGLRLMARAGSAADDLDALLPVLQEVDGRRCLLVNDDVTVLDLLGRGHLTEHLRRCVAAGMTPAAALRMVTSEPAEHFGLTDRGTLAPGRRADVVAFADLDGFAVAGVWHGGQPVEDAAPRAAAPVGEELRLPDAISLERAREAAAAVPAIGWLDGQLLTVRDDTPPADAPLLLAVDRHTGRRVAAARVTGFGLRAGALATTVAHDHHNLLVLGADLASIQVALDAARGSRGLMLAVRDGAVAARLELDLGGLMASGAPEQVAVQLRAVLDAARGLGCVAHDPLMALSFLGLEVIPALKLTDHGLVDVDTMLILGGVVAA